jgi:glycogen debranching enzyme
MVEKTEIISPVEKSPTQRERRFPSAIEAIHRLQNFDLLLPPNYQGEEELSFDKVPVAAVPPKGEFNQAYNIYAVEFGRDALLTATDLLDYDPVILEQTILYNTIWQGTDNENGPNQMGGWSEEEVGRIPHEVRDPNNDRAREFCERRHWAFPYYGAIDATPFFVKSSHKYCEHLGHKELLWKQVESKNGHKKTVAESMILAVEWMESRMRQNPCQIIEAHSPNPDGCLHQFWRDALDSYFTVEGEPANRKGVSSTEVHGLTFDAMYFMVNEYLPYFLNLTDDEFEEIFSNQGYSRDFFVRMRDRLERRLEILKDFVQEELFVEDENGSYFAKGTHRREDGSLEVLPARCSNMGWLLNSEMFDDPEDQKYVQATIETLTNEDMMTRWGIRTLSEQELNFDPTSYHNGSVWAMDVGQIIRGLEKQGYYGLARNLAIRTVSAVNHLGIYPEFIQGNNREIPAWNQANGSAAEETHHSQQMQAWTISAVYYAKRLLGKMGRGDLPSQASDLDKQNFEQQVLAKTPDLPPIKPTEETEAIMSTALLGLN